jgi:deoxyribonuclease V
VPWPATPQELIAAQEKLASASPAPWAPPSTGASVGGCIVCFPRGQRGPGAVGDPAWAAAAVLRGGRVVAQAIVSGTAGGQYLPGLLALREGPLFETALRALHSFPDVLLVDATGRDHPRRAGLAVHLGAVTGIATVGVTHRPLLAVGAWPEHFRGATSPLALDGEHVGVWLRTRAGTRPLAVHPGWRTTIDAAVEIVLGTTMRHRTPEPLREARRLARDARAAATPGPSPEPPRSDPRPR